MAGMPGRVSAKPTKPFDVNRLTVDDAWPLSLWLFGGDVHAVADSLQ